MTAELVGSVPSYVLRHWAFVVLALVPFGWLFWRVVTGDEE